MSARDRVILIVLAAVGALVGSWMLVIAPQRTQATALGAQVSSLQTQLATAQSQVTAGLAARRSFAADYTQLASLGEAMPQDDDMPSLIYELQSAASSSQVGFHALQLVPGAGATSTPAPSASSASSQTLPPGAAVGAAGFPTDQFTFTFTGDYFHLASFLSRLQNFVVAGSHGITVSGRLLSVNSITLGPSSSGFPHISATVSATSYMAPASTGLLDGATSAGPAGTGATSSATPTVAQATITPSLR